MMCAVLPLIIDARRAALAGLLDHAALFPPACMTMADALAEDARVRAGADSWLVRRFVVPASRLGELGDAELPLALVLDAPYAGGDPRVEAVEARPGTDPETVAGLAAEIYVELPADLARLAQLGLRAKVRCGGAAVPSVDGAGRGRPRLPSARARLQGDRRAPPRRPHRRAARLPQPARRLRVPGDEEAVLADDDPAAFALDDGRIPLARPHARERTSSRAVRADLFAGFGSCSVAEPADELRALGIL